MKLKIKEMYAFIATDDKGNEGVISHKAFVDGRFTHFLFVAADVARVESLKDMTRILIKPTLKPGTKITVARFSIREDIDKL